MHLSTVLQSANLIEAAELVDEELDDLLKRLAKEYIDGLVKGVDKAFEPYGFKLTFIPESSSVSTTFNVVGLGLPENVKIVFTKPSFT